MSREAFEFVTVKDDHHVFQDSDHGKLVCLQTASPTVTIPSDDTANIRVGAYMRAVSEGGDVTIKAETGVEVKMHQGLTMKRLQNQPFVMIKRDRNVWLVC